MDRTKIPNWKSLCSFLEKNEHVFIDPCSNELIRSRYGRNIPDIIRTRMIIASNKSTPNNSINTANVKQSVGKQLPKDIPNPSSIASKQLPTPVNNTKQNSYKSANNANSKATTMVPSQAPTFNPFSPNSAAQLQGLTELLASGAGTNIDFNNPLTSIMAAALQSQPGAASGTANPFMLPPFAPPPNSQLPPSFFAEILAAAAGGAGGPGTTFDEITTAAASLAAAIQLPPHSSLPPLTAPAQASNVHDSTRPPSSSSTASSSYKQPSKTKESKVKNEPTKSAPPAPGT